MARIYPIGFIKQMSGKLCIHSNESFRRRGKKTFSYILCNPSRVPATASQLSNREKFSRVRSRVKEIMSDAELRSSYEGRWNKQKYYTLQDFISHCVWQEGV